MCPFYRGPAPAPLEPAYREVGRGRGGGGVQLEAAKAELRAHGIEAASA
jgi:hypothetical protein